MMKPLIAILPLLFLINACSDSPAADPWMRWAPIDPQFDSLMREAQIIAYTDSAREAMPSLVDSLGAIARRSGLRQLKARASFWQGLSALRNGSQEDAARCFATALTECDTSRYPYDYYRMRTQASRQQGLPVADIYFQNLEALEHYTKLGDSIMMAGMYTELGLCLLRLRDSTRAIDYFDRVDAIGPRTLPPAHRLYNRLNKAVCLPAHARDSAIRVILADTLAKADPAFCEKLYLALFETSDSMCHLDRAAQYASQLADTGRYRAIYAVARANYYRTHPDIPGWADSVTRYAFEGRRHIRPGHPPETRLRLLNSLPVAFDNIGLTDSALYYAGLFIAMFDRYVRDSTSSMVGDMELRLKIKEHERMEATRALKWKLWLGAGILIVALGAIIALWTARKRRLILELVKRNADLELRHKEEQLEIQHLILEGRQNIIRDIADKIDAVGSDSASLRSLSSSVRAQVASQDTATFNASLAARGVPEFEKRLKDAYPTLSQRDLKIASYTATGLSTKEIATLLLMEYPSVISARYRLRRKMGLGRDESLDDALRRYKN